MVGRGLDSAGREPRGIHRNGKRPAQIGWSGDIDRGQIYGGATAGKSNSRNARRAFIQPENERFRFQIFWYIPLHYPLR